MPSERALGTALGVSRNTVAKAFDELRGDGMLTSRQGDGTYVSVGRRHLAPLSEDRLRSFVFVPEPGTDEQIDLRSAALPGLPMVADEINNLDGSRMRALVATHGYQPSGLPELRQAVANYYSALGLATEPEHIVVTSGAQQALRLVASSLIDRGATVLVEEPSFRGALESLGSIGANLVGVPSGPDGIDVDALARTAAAARPSLIVVQSTVHNPTGSVMDRFRRSRVVSIADRLGIPVIDDATLADTIIDGDRRPLPLAVGSDNIVTVGSVSKSFWGGLRVGWVRAHPDIIEQLAAAKGGEDLGTSLVAQLLASQLLPRIEWARDQRHETLSRVRHEVVELLASELPDWEPQVPAGGASIWIKLPSACGPAFVHRAARSGVRILPGPTFSSRDALEDFVRLSYSGPLEQTARGIVLLGRAWRAFDGA
jgi:DNA-binding transcriptional MocR family regulator